MAFCAMIEAVDHHERLRRLALKTIDLAKDPFFMCNHLGSYQCSSGNGEGVDAHDDVGRGEIEGWFLNEVPRVSFMTLDLSSHGSKYVQNGEFEIDNFGLNQAIGITKEVFTFARNISMHPETWLDFPIDEEEDKDDSSYLLRSRNACSS